MGGRGRLSASNRANERAERRRGGRASATSGDRPSIYFTIFGGERQDDFLFFLKRILNRKTKNAISTAKIRGRDVCNVGAATFFAFERALCGTAALAKTVKRRYNRQGAVRRDASLRPSSLAFVGERRGLLPIQRINVNFRRDFRGVLRFERC